MDEHLESAKRRAVELNPDDDFPDASEEQLSIHDGGECHKMSDPCPICGRSVQDMGRDFPTEQQMDADFLKHGAE